MTSVLLNVLQKMILTLVICKIILPNKEPILLCAVYRPPNSNLVYLENVITTLTNIVRNNPQSPIWIAGDFNLPIINWSDGSISGNNYPHTFAELLLDFSNTYGFTQMVDAPTRKHNILDLFLTNRPSLVKSCQDLVTMKSCIFPLMCQHLVN